MRNTSSELHFVTGNTGKFIQLQDVLQNVWHGTLHQAALDIDEIQADTVAEVAVHKARTAFELLKKPIVIEDSGLFLDALNGFPGPYVKYAISTLGAQGFVDIIPPGKPRTCTWVSVVVHVDEYGTETIFEDASERGRLATHVWQGTCPERARSEMWRVYIPGAYNVPLAALEQETLMNWNKIQSPFRRLGAWLAEQGQVQRKAG